MRPYRSAIVAMLAALAIGLGGCESEPYPKLKIYRYAHVPPVVDLTCIDCKSTFKCDMAGGHLFTPTQCELCNGRLRHTALLKESK